MQFRSDPFLAPRRIRTSHGDNQLLKIQGEWWSAARPRLPPPKEVEPFAMPADQRRRFHDRKHGSPVDQPGERDEGDPCRIIGTARLHLALSIDANCFRRNRFSAASRDRDRMPSDTNTRASTSNRTAVRHMIDGNECFRMPKHATARRSLPRGSAGYQNRREFQFGRSICGSQVDGAARLAADRVGSELFRVVQIPDGTTAPTH